MTPRRIVLDTNVCLDLFVFGDPRCAALRDALDRGVVAAVTREDCRDEWLAVLEYARLGLDDAARETGRALYDRYVTPFVAIDAVPALPRCGDPDDQKFLELAATAGAKVLFSRDAELLRLSRRTSRDHGFAVVTPETWGSPHASL
ncbi:putative nucleic acid-binding protein [Luteibacter rhizovicinus]|uniref:Putative nucleic acid-binding protein n=1 Tax=Luteibacter rhizovicinus TaxID=242606 RepID=A0A4R3YNM2_9GAMM|nr:PIN domain-containing protein [Luteibacter rhizovicinus]TCV92754.1 putative nucleic acid-binding protein [Luteibacter rhizovicinus]